MNKGKKIEEALKAFKIKTKVRHSFEGYSSASYLLEVNPGTPIRSINRYQMDIANALNVPNVRIGTNLTVHDGEAFVSVEAGVKSDRTLFFDKDKLVDMKIPIGIDNFGKTVVWDLDNHSTPHMLMGGATGSGKSVSIKSTIEYALLAGVDALVIFDPKHEFKEYNKYKNIQVVNEIQDIESVMADIVGFMEYKVTKGLTCKMMVVFDEFADALANSRRGRALKGERSLDSNLQMILQKGRSSGFRVMAATQRASTKVITGDSKVNFPVKLCFRVPSATDSRVMIDENGAETLNGRGDFLMKSPEYLHMVRGQGFFYNG